MFNNFLIRFWVFVRFIYNIFFNVLNIVVVFFFIFGGIYLIFKYLGNLDLELYSMLIIVLMLLILLLFRFIGDIWDLYIFFNLCFVVVVRVRFRFRWFLEVWMFFLYFGLRFLVRGICCIFELIFEIFFKMLLLFKCLLNVSVLGLFILYSFESWGIFFVFASVF